MTTTEKLEWWIELLGNLIEQVPETCTYCYDFEPFDEVHRHRDGECESTGSPYHKEMRTAGESACKVFRPIVE